MKLSANTLKKLEAEYPSYLEGDDIDRFFEDFGIKFAAGHWCAGDFVDRFATGGYGWGASDIVSQIKRVHAAGIKGIEFHNSVFLTQDNEVDEDLIGRVKDMLREFDMVPTNMNTNLWTDPKWKMGGITNPSKKIREEAIEVAIQGIEVAKKLGCSSVALWPGSDGWDYNFEVNYGEQLRLFTDGCEKINREAKRAGLVFGLEPKLHEPRENNMVVPTVGTGALVAREVNERCGGKNMGICIDYGHELMLDAEAAQDVYLLKQFGVPLVNFHVNTAKTHSNDEDRVSGMANLWAFTDFLLAAIDTGYDGWFGEDQFTYRMDPVKAMRLSKELFANCMKKALLVYSKKDELERIRETGDQAEIINLVKRIILQG